MDSIFPKPIPFQGSASRARIPSQTIEQLEWEFEEAELECYLLIRKKGELLCAPVEAQTEDGDHPFQSAVDIINLHKDTNTPSLADIPPAHTILASHRLTKVKAKWTNSSKNQLDLKLNKKTIALLGKGQSNKFYAVPWGTILVLLSEQVFEKSLEEDFTGGDMNL